MTWPHLSKSRRSAVYRAVGRASKLAREADNATLAADLRIAMDVLRRSAVRPKRMSR
jgi:hypothetical protein